MGGSEFVWIAALTGLGATYGCGGAVVSEPTAPSTRGSIASQNGAAVSSDAGPVGSFDPGSSSGGGGVGGAAPNGAAPNGGVASSTTPLPSGVGPGLPGVVALAGGQTCPWGMAIDASNVYWTNCGDPTGGSVLKVPKVGGAVVTLATGQRLSGVAVNTTNVYWVAGTSDGARGAIMTVPVGGGAPTTLASRPGAPANLAADASYVYWTEQTIDTVMKLPLTGGAPATVASATPAWQIALGNADVYWIGQGLMKAPKVGGAAIELTSPMPMRPTSGLAVDATNVYFTSGPPGVASGVTTVPTQGGLVTVVSTDPAGAFAPPGPIAVDATRAYWADGSGVVSCVPLSGGTATTLATGQENVVAIAVDQTAVYWLVNGNGGARQGAVMRLPLSALNATGH